MNPERGGNGASSGTTPDPAGTKTVSREASSPSTITTNYFRTEDSLTSAGWKCAKPELEETGLGKKALQAKKKLKRAIDETMKGHLSKHAIKVVDAYGNPL